MIPKAALIPAYCPEETLPELVDELILNDMICVVINDGSPAEYDPIFEKVSKDTIVLVHEKNKGKGAALKTGMKYIRENIKECVVVTADADGQHLTKDVVRCAEKAAARRGALVLGERTFKKGDVPFRSYYGNKITEILFRLFTGKRVSDTQTGLRAFDSSMIPCFLKIEGERYEYEMNQLLLCAEQKIPIEAIPITTVYEDGNKCSHFNPLRDSFLIYKKLIKFALSSFSGFLVDYLLFGIFSILFTGSAGILAANVLARVISATFNYEINRKVVFKDDTNRKDSFFKYALLAAAVLVCNTAILFLLVQGLGVPKLLAKILTEITLFLVSWTVQNKLIFAVRPQNEKAGDCIEKKNVSRRGLSRDPRAGDPDRSGDVCDYQNICPGG